MSVPLTQFPSRDVPFSTRGREFSFAPLPGGFGYAFDFENPSGVKLLTPALYSKLTGQAGFAPFRDGTAPDGLNILSSLSKNPYSAQKPKRLTVWLHVINGCNFCCHYCYVPHLDNAVCNISESQRG